MADRPRSLWTPAPAIPFLVSTQFLKLQALDTDVGANPRKGSGFVGNAAWIKATVKVGNEMWRDHEFLAMGVLPDISNAVGQKIDGIMGEDILKEFAIVEIDFKHRRLVLLR